ncbi:MAG: NAD(P)/FAD-dependent oxidoreductase [Candidatus Omnitrophota bacterium]
MQYDAIIIGAGVAGLAAAYKLSRQGKKIILLERQPVAGGYATVFKRKGFTFESSVHCVDSLFAGEELMDLLQKYGLDKKIEFIPLKDFSRLIYPEHDLVADFDLSDYARTLKTGFAQESRGIDSLFRQIHAFSGQFKWFINSDLPYWLKLILSPIISPMIIKLSLCTAESVIKKHIKNEKLYGILTDVWKFAGLSPSRLSALYFFIIFNGYYNNRTTYIKGGMVKLFENMINEIRTNGSEVKFNTTVEKITTINGIIVKGVVTDKGEEFFAKTVISNASGINTLAGMIDNEPLKNVLRPRLEAMEKSISATQVYLGLNTPAKALGMDHFMLSVNLDYNHDRNFAYCQNGDYRNCSLAIVDHAQLDPGLAPEGKGTLLIMALDSFSNWEGLSADEYLRKKSEAGNILIQRAEKLLPGLTGHIEIMEVATPKTMERYTLSPRGAIYGFAQTVAQSGINRLSQNTDIKGLFLAGAWTQPGGGVHACFLSGDDAAGEALNFLTKRN